MTPNHRDRQRYIASEAEATAMASEAMALMGFDDAQPAPDASATGLSIVSESAVARVAFAGQPNIADLQRLGAIHELEPDMALLAFSANGYSDATRAFAENNRIALFVYDPLGNVDAVNDHAVPLEKILFSQLGDKDESDRHDEPRPSRQQEQAATGIPDEPSQPPLEEASDARGPAHAGAQPETADSTKRTRKRSLRGWWWRWPLLALVIFCWFGAFVIALGTIGDPAYWGNLAFYGIPAVLGTIGLQWSRKRRTLGPSQAQSR
ncbi:hypothetical protein [Demequina sediminicola]|uniref:hypothetical protein n=1 Tax=Demequina sediminicola TaxID=1095026 RepID=UPI000783F08B|nr:hypothetical protein [Demequina sediminicola]